MADWCSFPFFLSFLIVSNPGFGVSISTFNLERYSALNATYLNAHMQYVYPSVALFDSTVPINKISYYLLMQSRKGPCACSILMLY